LNSCFFRTLIFCGLLRAVAPDVLNGSVGITASPRLLVIVVFVAGRPPLQCPKFVVDTVRGESTERSTEHSLHLVVTEADTRRLLRSIVLKASAARFT
jgi:hypothetical protein